MSDEHYRSSEFSASAERGCGLMIIWSIVFTAMFYAMLWIVFGWQAVVGTLLFSGVVVTVALWILRKSDISYE